MKCFRHLIVTSLVSIGFSAIASGEYVDACYYLDKDRIDGRIQSLAFANEMRLDETGLHQGNERVCRWSHNGGSGVKERFSLDGDFAVPILDPECEAPFSHEVTGVGFGDWYLTLCGSVVDGALHVRRDETEHAIRLDSLGQWTEFTPGQFPIEGDRE